MRKKLGALRRILAGALCAAVLAGYVPTVSVSAAAAEEPWVQPYLNKLVDWGVMRGDQLGNLDPDRPISRAEFVSMVNRAYGYTQPGETPFTDVPTAAWFADDIGIAYRSGYFTGTTENTASPDAYLTREQATVILARNLALQGEDGESMDFTDSRELSEWSRALVKNAARYGIAKGYPDGSFRPQNHITRGEVASLLVSAVGTPVNQPGDHVLGDVYGNVTISTGGVTLKNTVIAGDLYLTGGVGLGNVTLENVTVLGRIIASGAGESQKGDSSIILRNVEAPEMVVDTPANQFVTLRAEGDTRIGKISVRTPAYLEDTTGEDFGLRQIVLDAENGTTLQLAGNIKEVVNMTSAGRLVIAKGEAQLVTVDEKALGSTVSVEMGAHIRDLRLDVATNVDGPGAVGKVTVNAPGSTVTMLPDQIYIRPGLDASIGGDSMNTVTGQESSEAPRLLAGFPKVKNVAATAADAVFSTNKKATVYWAISAVSDGSVGEEELVEPSKYGSIVVKNGSMKADLSNQAYPIAVTGLNKASGYYLSAMAEDERGQRSPVKVISFGTPDDTVPNFAPNHPFMSKITHNAGQMTVMTTKDCRVYYALMPKGAVAPTPADFKGGNLSGNLGYGTLDVTKNNTYTQWVNDVDLKEVVEYDLYVWLSDIDGAKSSAVKKLSFTTVDMTPPTFEDPMMTTQQTTSVNVVTTMNENGTLSWVAVRAGSDYLLPKKDGTIPGLGDQEAKIQVANGAGTVVKSGKLNMTMDRQGIINVTGLAAEGVYDFYCIAQDTAGNYAAAVKVIRINTLDPNAPTATIEFDKVKENNKLNPSADTNMRVIFSEEVLTYERGQKGTPLVDLYTAVKNGVPNAKAEMATALKNIFSLWDLTSGTEKAVKTHPEADWTINYEEAEIIIEDGKTVVIFETPKALNLQSGSTYRLDVQNVTDQTPNLMPKQSLPDAKGFTTLFAEVGLVEGDQKVVPVGGTDVKMHTTFTMTPDATSKVADAIGWDMVIWSDVSMQFELYVKKPGGDWSRAGNNLGIITIPFGQTGSIGVSATKVLQGSTALFEPLNQLKDNQVYEYGIHISQLEGSNFANENTWNKIVNMKVNLVAATTNALNSFASGEVTADKWRDHVQTRRSVTSIGYNAKESSDELLLEIPFTDTVEPKFINDYPQFEPGDTGAVMTVMMDRPTTVYYTVAPAGKVNTIPKDPADSAAWADLPTDGTTTPPELSTPGYLDIVGNKYQSVADSAWGTIEGGNYATPITVNNLKPETEYIVYFVLKGSSAIYSTVKAYAFETQRVVRPVLELSVDNPSVNITTDVNAKVDYLLLTEQSIPSFLQKSLNECLVSGAASDPRWNEDWKEDDFRLWEAIQTDVQVNDVSVGSVFDLFVIQREKDTVQGYIRNTQTNDSVVLKSPQGGVSVGPGAPLVVNCAAHMKAGVQYVFLAVAKSPLGSGDAFRGIRPVNLRDVTSPYVESVSAVLSYVPGPAGTNGTYRGTLDLLFSEPLYLKDTDEAGVQSYPGVEAISGTTASDGFVTLTSVILTRPNGLTIKPGTTGKALQSMAFTISLASAGATNNNLGTVIGFDPNLSDKAGNKGIGALRIRLVEIDPVAHIAEFQIESPGWLAP